MTARIGCVACGVVALIALASPGRADMTFTPQRGGSGGGEFDIRCGAASYVSGITVFSGWWVDGITVHCGILNRNNLPNRFFEREVAPYNAPAHTGGSQPHGETLSCGSDHAVIGLEVYPVAADGPRVVAQFALICQGMMPPYRIVTSAASAAQAPRYLDVSDRDIGCRAHQWAVGVYGRSGIYIDSIGLICDSEFTAAPPTAAASPVVVPLPQKTTNKDPFLKALKGFGQDFPAPTINGAGIDVCLHWGSSCGAPAADEFCRRQGLKVSVANTVQNDAPPTFILGDNAICKDPACDRFATISCR